jgi:hypothetical protein
MVVAMMPSQIAGELHAKTETLESALEKNACQQRSVQSPRRRRERTESQKSRSRDAGGEMRCQLSPDRR